MQLNFASDHQMAGTSDTEELSNTVYMHSKYSQVLLGVVCSGYTQVRHVLEGEGGSIFCI